MIKHITKGATIAAVVCLAAPWAHARSTGWVDGNEWIRIARTLDKNGEMPVSIVCKDKETKGLSRASGLGKIEIQKNPKKIAWHWAFGDKVAVLKRRLEKEGYELVSYSEYRRASGLKIPCAIWHKIP